jgi:toxin ParE1/3/4
MKVTVRAEAEDDLGNLFDWIAKDNPHAARAIVARIRDRINLLEIDALARMGRRGRVGGTLELIEHPYLIVYRVRDEERVIEVLSIVHGARDRQADT